MGVLVEFHDGNHPTARMETVADAEIVVICHGGGLYTVYKDRHGEVLLRKPWTDLPYRIRKAIVEEVRS